MTYRQADMSLWKRKRLKDQAAVPSDRFWSGQVCELGRYSPDDTLLEGELTPLALIGFASDEGIKRNAGRSGAIHGPLVIRKALASLAWHLQRKVFDAGDIWCEEEQLIIAQSQLAGHIAHLLDMGLQPMILGGGREMVWASYQGASRYVSAGQADAAIGVISLSSRLALADTEPQPSALSAFYQIARHCEERNLDFPCFCLGVDEQVTSIDEFDRAEEYGVLWRLSAECERDDFADIRQDVSEFLASLDYLYLSVSLDLFSFAAAPGVSAPSPFGLDARTGIGLLKLILEEARRAEVPLLLADIAECNPLEDADGRTARLAAGLIFELARL
ncbi:formimidoylglutamase [Oceanospirillum sanctuarii]|uniref:formimidoylglutamase n=1 Tax=Oceanospirillum sanctuarii TaxID=1434821 RepID=UPI000A3B0D75|nr:formimidoylglutamase [Oceanospirillum sanctuarii]